MGDTEDGENPSLPSEEEDPDEYDEPVEGSLLGFLSSILYGCKLFPMVSYLFSVEHELLDTTDGGW